MTMYPSKLGVFCALFALYLVFTYPFHCGAYALGIASMYTYYKGGSSPLVWLKKKGDALQARMLSGMRLAPSTRINHDD